MFPLLAVCHLFLGINSVYYDICDKFYGLKNEINSYFGHFTLLNNYLTAIYKIIFLSKYWKEKYKYKI